MDTIAKLPEYIFSEGFLLAVQMGRVKGFSAIDKFGVNLSITPATDPEDIWEFGGTYNYDANNTAPIKYLSSASATDIQPITVVGLDINGNEVIQTKALNGQTNVLLDTPLWRVYRMFNNGTTSLTGMVYCHTDNNPTAGVPLTANVRAIIDDGHNQTLMALYTIPKGKVGFLMRGEIGLELESTGIASGEFAHLHYESRRYGKVFTVKKAVSIVTGGDSIYKDRRTFPDIMPALTDIKLRVIEVSAEMGFFGTFDILLADETMFPNDYLKAIGQPGY